MKVAIVGGGAAGLFAAISVKQHHEAAQVEILEKSEQVLAKVKISGGGRCNVTHQCFRIPEMVANYPRGSKLLKRVFRQFFTTDTIEFFESRGVPIKAEADGRMFPTTNRSQSIIDCLVETAESHQIRILFDQRVREILPQNDGAKLLVNGSYRDYDKVILATGGSPNKRGFDWLQALNVKVVSPVPSLFTFNVPKNEVTELQGVAVQKATVQIEGAKWKTQGPLLITHWGFSGPAVLRLSAFSAEWLHEKNYEYTVKINWMSETNEEVVRAIIREKLAEESKKKMGNIRLDDIPVRLWLYLLYKADINEEMRCSELPKKSLNRLINLLTNDAYLAKGKTTFKEEFVTCGGIDLSEVHADTMALKKHPSIYVAGELLNVDGVTGGFNFQAAWSTGFVAGKLAT